MRELENNMLLQSNESVKPFLRWAGGKTWLVKYLKGLKTTAFRNYHEAFLGGGAVFFYLRPENKSFLSDLNGDLIETYIELRDNADKIIEKLRTFKNDQDSYYEIRGTFYESRTERAARLIYLNQTSYNGIYRVNLKGVYNVPYGFRTKDFLEESNLLRAQQALQNVKLDHCDFYSIIENVKRGDVVFLDPPYTVSHNNNGFIKYNEKIFSLEDQIRLSQLIVEIRKKGAYYILTNAFHETIEEIFEKGDNKILLERASLIGGTKSKRGQTNELVFTNLNL